MGGMATINYYLGLDIVEIPPPPAVHTHQLPSPFVYSFCTRKVTMPLNFTSAEDAFKAAEGVL
ncbi:hypothetical protein IRJ41_004005 [Triplophysa rosa]|uniref:Uncharacterized protein n=1 Tax=Triplophysa rosa TaxID=992332 RepID=A0A9W8C886_TRIRA|nr:hypothetical protein IRJ41_004005 [Triplophysa rosa]